MLTSQSLERRSRVVSLRGSQSLAAIKELGDNVIVSLCAGFLDNIKSSLMERKIHFLQLRELGIFSR